jgi:hypothetical protein
MSCDLGYPKDMVPQSTPLYRVEETIDASRGLRAARAMVIMLVLTLFAGFAAWMIISLASVSSLNRFFHDIVKPLYWTQLTSLRFWYSPLVLFVFPFFLLATVIFPADGFQRVFSRGLFQDLTWSIARTTLIVLLLTAYTAYLSEVFHRYFHWAIFEAGELPLVLRAVLVFLVGDFLYWLRHLVLHKVPALWHFHAIHHSQTQLNPFSIHRVHPGELLLTLSIWFMPMFALMTSLDIAPGYYFVHYFILQAHDAFVHSNIRTNLGSLRFILVTPQSHRVHHSHETEHYDTNYGAMLSVWDHLFGTQHRSYDTYPRTGISDSDFPKEEAGSNLVVTLVQQFLYPFRSLKGYGLPLTFRKRSIEPEISP